MRNENFGRISFRKIKEIVRNKNFDFSDDGNYFRGYVYKGMLPISVLCREGEIYISPRYDYLISYDEAVSAGLKDLDSNKYNGANTSDFDQEDFHKILENVLNLVLKFRTEEELKKYCDEKERYFYYRERYYDYTKKRYCYRYHSYTRKF